MEHIDPRPITATDWVVLASLVDFGFTGLWGLVFFNYSFAGTMLLAHIIIPSLVATGHIPPSLERTRPILTVIAALFLLCSVIVVLNWLNALPILYDIYPKRLL